jgi:hypothetical protein
MKDPMGFVSLQGPISVELVPEIHFPEMMLQLGSCCTNSQVLLDSRVPYSSWRGASSDQRERPEQTAESVRAAGRREQQLLMMKMRQPVMM